MGFAHRAFVAAGAGFAVSAIVGCGGSGGSWLSGSQSSGLTEQLNRVEQALQDGRCADAQQYLANFQSNVDNLNGVNSTLVANLDQGASTIQSLANQECHTATTPKRTHPKTTTQTTTTQTQTTQTFTNPATQTYTTTTYTQQTDTTSSSTTTTSTNTQPSNTTTTNTTGGGGLSSDTSTDTTSTGATTTSTDTTSGGGGF